MPLNYSHIQPYTEETLYDSIQELCGDKQCFHFLINQFLDRGPVDPPEYYELKHIDNPCKIPIHTYEWELVVYAH